MDAITEVAAHSQVRQGVWSGSSGWKPWPKNLATCSQAWKAMCPLLRLLKSSGESGCRMAKGSTGASAPVTRATSRTPWGAGMGGAGTEGRYASGRAGGEGMEWTEFIEGKGDTELERQKSRSECLKVSISRGPRTTR
jgi:hypothetical protein